MSEYKKVEKKGTCEKCNHPCEKHAFDVYPMKNPNKPCELSCMICFDEETDRLKTSQQSFRSGK